MEPKSEHSMGDRSFRLFLFLVAAARLWNDPPLSIRTSQSLEIFKKNLDRDVSDLYTSFCRCVSDIFYKVVLIIVLFVFSRLLVIKRIEHF